MNKNIKYNYSCYRYAPESFKASYSIGNIKGNFNLTSDLISKLGNWAICGENKKVIDEFKRYYRDHIKIKNQKVCYGVFELDNDKQYKYIKEFNANKYNMQEKLKAYKEFKEYFNSINWEIKEGEKATLGANFQAEKVEDIIIKLNKNRLIEVTII